MKAKDAMFLGWLAEGDEPAKMEVVSKPEYVARGIYVPCDFSMGAAFFCWKEIPASKIMACVLCTGFYIAENYGVPIAEVAKELEKIEGFTDYWNEIGVMTGMR
jgi:hypothetical protein